MPVLAGNVLRLAFQLEYITVKTIPVSGYAVWYFV